MRKNIELNNVTYYGVTRLRTVENGEITYWVPEGSDSGSSGNIPVRFENGILYLFEDLTPPIEANAILLENGEVLLTESGDTILFDD